MGLFRTVLPMLLLTAVAAVPQSRAGDAAAPPAPAKSPKECLDNYLAQIRAAEASGDYSHYEEYAKQYVDCLAQFGPADFASSWSDILAPLLGTSGASASAAASSTVQSNCAAAHAAALANAQAAGDATAAANLNNAYQSCLAGRKR